MRSKEQQNAITILQARVTRLSDQIKNGSLSAHGRRTFIAKMNVAVDALEWARNQGSTK